MPFLIKSSAGQRSCKLVTNRPEVNSAREDMIEALKGLTIKFEVKIIDVVPTEDEVDAEKNTRPSNGTKTAQSASDEANSMPQVQLKKIGSISVDKKPTSSQNDVKRLVQEAVKQGAMELVREGLGLNEPTPVADPIVEPRFDMKPSNDTASDLSQGPPRRLESKIRPRCFQETAGQVQVNRVREELSPSPVPQPVEEARHRQEEWKASPTFAPVPATVPAPKGAPIAEPVPSLVQTFAPTQSLDFSSPSPMTIQTPAKEVDTRNTTAITREKEAAIPVIAAARPRPVDKCPLNKGDMKIGSLVKTCCVSVDEATNVAYVPYDNQKLIQLTQMILNMGEEIENQSHMGEIEKYDIVFAKSQDDNSWYRAIIEDADGSVAKVYFFDWGLRESLSYNRVRRLTNPALGLSKFPACALKVKFTNEYGPLLDEALKCEYEFKMKVDSYDDFDEAYQCTLVDDTA